MTGPSDQNGAAFEAAPRWGLAFSTRSAAARSMGRQLASDPDVSLTLTCVTKLVMLALVLAACGGEGTQIPRTQLADPGALIFNGYTKPAVKCFGCHNGDGSGTKFGPPLAKRVPRRSDDQLRKVILEGRGNMPAFRDKLDDAELAQLVAWLRHEFDRDATPTGPPS